MTAEHITCVPCPCTPDCLDRRALCFSTCEAYREYELSRTASYENRAKVRRQTDDAMAGLKRTAVKSLRERAKRGRR